MIEQIQPSLNFLRITSEEFFSNTKAALKKAFLSYKKEINKNFNFLFKELKAEKTNLQNRLKEGCPFAKSSLEALEDIEKTLEQKKKKL